MGSSITSLTEKAATYPRPTVKTISANPAETGYSILNEQPENQTWGRSNWPGGEAQEDTETFTAGIATARRRCVYFLKKWSSVPLW